MKRYIIALSLALTSGLSFAGNQGIVLSEMEMAAIKGEGLPQYRTSAFDTWLYQTEGSPVHTHQAIVRPGLWYWHTVRDGSPIHMMCQSRATGRTASFQGNVYGTKTLTCPS